MTEYYVAEPPTLNSNNQNTWSMYLLVDGFNIGDTNPTYDSTQPESATNPQNLALSQTLVFDTSGNLSSTNPVSPILIDDWVPRNADGNPNGAAGPLAGIRPTTPPNSSNFTFDLQNPTQHSGSFSVSQLTQDGFGTGSLVGLEVGAEGQIVGRYTNSEVRTFAAVALANFTNEQGLIPSGDTNWRASSASGGAVVNQPGSGATGLIQSKALEESNVDLSDELVGLIIAQRNYQANAKTIETMNTISQTILNI